VFRPTAAAAAATAASYSRRRGPRSRSSGPSRLPMVHPRARHRFGPSARAALSRCGSRSRSPCSPAPTSANGRRRLPTVTTPLSTTSPRMALVRVHRLSYSAFKPVHAPVLATGTSREARASAASVLLRSDGVPLYNVGAVVDDITMTTSRVSAGHPASTRSACLAISSSPRSTGRSAVGATAGSTRRGSSRSTTII
jgi:hypothetical protein